MARTQGRSIHEVLGDARSALGMTQEEFGIAVGASHRSAVRWDAGQATPGVHQLHTLTRLLYPQHRALAAEVAAHADESLESLGLEAPPPPVPPRTPHGMLRPEDLVDVVVLAAVEITGSPSPAVRSLLHAVFKRGREVGLTMEDAEKALRPAAKGEPSGARGA